MARKGRMDRGLMKKTDVNGKTVWCVRLYHEGKERRISGFKTKTQARDFYEKAKQEQKQGRFFPERYQQGGYELVQEMIDRYLTTIQTKKDQRSERGFGLWWKDWFKGRRLNHMTVGELEQARQSLLKKGSDPQAKKPQPCSPQRVNRYLQWLRHVLNQAIREGKLSSNPVTQLTLYKERVTKTRCLSMKEETTLCEALGSPYDKWVRLAILTGLRRGEQFSLRWSDVDVEQGLLTLPITKGGGVQYVQLTKEAKAIFRTIDTWQFSMWVFPSRNPATHIDPCVFYRYTFLPKIRALALKDVTWHTLRHTFASRLAMQGATDYDIASCLRHSTTSLVRRYAHLSPSHLRGVMERVSTFGKEESSPKNIPTQGASNAPISNGTVTETVIERSS